MRLPFPRPFPARLVLFHMVVVFLVVLAACLFTTKCVKAHMHDRPDLDDWWPTLKSGKGPCCSGPDSRPLSDFDWKTEKVCTPAGYGGAQSEPRCRIAYTVYLEDIFGKKPRWVEVSEDAVVEGPNKYGPAMAWVYYINNEPEVRCFIAGAQG